MLIVHHSVSPFWAVLDAAFAGFFSGVPGNIPTLSAGLGKVGGDFSRRTAQRAPDD
jgi:hypothetical protein